MLLKAPLWDKQKKAIRYAIDNRNKGICLWAETRTGKTRISIEWIEWLFENENATLGIIFAPFTVKGVWPDDWGKWASTPIIFIDLHEMKSAGLQLALHLQKLGTKVICIINYEAARTLGFKIDKNEIDGHVLKKSKKVDTTLLDVNWDFCILDESTKIKTPTSKITKFMIKKFSPKAKFKLTLTGTAYEKRPLDVWSQVSFTCGLGTYFPEKYKHFFYDYAIPHPTIPNVVSEYRNLEQLAEKLSKCTFILKRNDMYDSEEPIHEILKLDLEPHVRELYEELKEEQYLELETYEKEGSVTATNILTRMIKLAELTSGFLTSFIIDETKDEPIKITNRLSNLKVDTILDILDTRDSPTIIITQRNEEEKMLAEGIEKRFNFTPKILNGSVKKNRIDYIKSASKDLAFIVKESVGEMGVSFKFADMFIFYSHSTDTEAYTQILARNRGHDQKDNLLVLHLLARNTVDYQIMRILQSDGVKARQLENDWRKYFK